MARQAEAVILEGKLRSLEGSRNSERLRRTGMIPGVVYGESKEPLSILVPARDLKKSLHTKAGENVLIDLRITDAKKENAVLIKELQRHPVTHEVIHVDFHRISLTKPITVTVPLTFKGEASGVKTGEGILEHLRWDLEVECLPTQIPAEIAVDVSSLEVGQTLEAKAIALPEGVRLITDPTQPVAACVIPKVEEIPAPAEAAAETAEPEVIKQKKPEEEEAAAQAEAGSKEKAPKEKAPKEKAPKEKAAKEEPRPSSSSAVKRPSG